MVYNKGMKKPLLIAILAISLTGCSLAGLGYRYADWLIKRKIMEVIKLYSPQQDRLEIILDEYMAWHKKEMLPKYREALEFAKNNVAASKEKPVTQQSVVDYMHRIRDLYSLSFIPLSKKVSPVLSELGEEQVERSRYLINKRLDDLKDKATQPKEQRLKELQETWRDNLNEYLGKVTPEQEKLLLLHSPKMLTSGRARFARGVTQMKNFLLVFEDHPIKNLKGEERAKTLKQREQRLMDFFNSWGDGSHYNNWRQETSLFISKLAGTLDDEQRAKFLEVLTSWEGKVKEMQED